MKNFGIIILTFVCSASLFAQDVCNIYFPFEHFESMTYADYNRRDKLQAKQHWEVLNLNTENGAKIAEIRSTIFDEDGEEVMTTEFIARCENETYHISLQGFHMQEFTESMSGSMEMEVSGTDMAIPNDLEVGKKLPDASLQVKAEGPMPLNVTVNVTDRLVEDRREITTPAGTFNAFEISQNTEVRAIIRARTSSKDFVTERYGVIKTESYNKRGKLQGYTQLEEVVAR